MFLLIAYVFLVVAFFAGIVIWSRQKKRDYANPSKRQKFTPAMAFLFKELQPDFYVSVQACIGFVLASVVAVVVYDIVIRLWFGTA